MKVNLLVLLLIPLLPQFSVAQGWPLTILSDKDNRFYLYLDGARLNNTPQAGVQVNKMPQKDMEIKVVFEDDAKGLIDKHLSATDINATTGLTYKITNSKGKLKLLPAGQGTLPADIYVVDYAQPSPAPPPANGGFVGITPVRSTGGTTTTEATMSFEAPGQPTKPAIAPAPCPGPMDAGDFKTAKEKIKAASYEDTKYEIAQNVLAANCFSTEQVIQICQLFGFEEKKLRFAKNAYPKVTDPANYAKVSNVFSFNASKTDLNNFISNGGR